MSPRGQRRGRGEGSIQERGPKTWRLRVFAGTNPVTGKPMQISRTFYGSRTDALRELRRFADDEQAKRSLNHTLGSLFDAWLLHLETADRALSTVETYRIVVEKHLRPALGTKRLRTLTAYDLDRYYAAQRARLSPRTIRQHHAIISSALTQGRKWGWLVANPAEHAEPPKLPAGKGMIPAVDEVRALIDACGDDPDLAILITVAALTGCRRGELCGLRWSDVGWEQGTLRIERQRVRVNGVDQTVPTKTKESRTVAVGELGVEVLRRWREASQSRLDLLAPGAVVDQDGWLLSTDGGISPWRSKNLGEAITAVGKRAQIPVTTHAFRRFAATQLVGSGTDVVTVAARLGHRPEILLKTYAGFLPERDRAAAVALEATVLGPVVE